jgi:hypothetical protein
MPQPSAALPDFQRVSWRPWYCPGVAQVPLNSGTTQVPPYSDFRGKKIVQTAWNSQAPVLSRLDEETRLFGQRNAGVITFLPLCMM